MCFILHFNLDWSYALYMLHLPTVHIQSYMHKTQAKRVLQSDDMKNYILQQL